MTREQIIKNLEYLIQFLPGKGIYAGETLTCAIAALREKAERENLIEKHGGLFIAGGESRVAKIGLEGMPSVLELGEPQLYIDNIPVPSEQWLTEAAREKRERENGCEYCFGDKPLYRFDGLYRDQRQTVSLNSEAGVIVVDFYDKVCEFEVNNCPMCGRGLKEAEE